MNITRIDDHYAVAGQIFPADVDAIAAAGYMSVICNRPDGEEPGQPPSRLIHDACRNRGIDFHFIPIAGAPPGSETIRQFSRALALTTGPVLAYCRSGARSTMIWQLVNSR